MKCEFRYCVYNKNLKCIIDEPEINTVGMCSECIIISLDEAFLEKEKERQLLRLSRE